jgi:hypothetical protein
MRVGRMIKWLVIPNGADSASYHSKRLGTDSCVEVPLRRQTSQGLTSCLPRNFTLAHFENKEVPTFLHFPVCCLSRGNLDLKPSTARQTGPRWTATPELMTDELDKSQVLKEKPRS